MHEHAAALVEFLLDERYRGQKVDEYVFVFAVIDVDMVLVERLAVGRDISVLGMSWKGVGRTALMVILPRIAVTTLKIFLALRDSTSRALGRLPIHKRGTISSMVVWDGDDRYSAGASDRS